MRINPLILLASILLISGGCEQKSVSSSGILTIGTGDCYKKTNSEELVEFDSTYQELTNYFNQLGKVQIPVNKILKSDSMITFINVLFNNDITNFKKAHINNPSFITLQAEDKNENPRYLLKHDTLHVYRSVHKPIDSDMIYVIDCISSDSSLVSYLFNNRNKIDDRFLCQ